MLSVEFIKLLRPVDYKFDYRETYLKPQPIRNNNDTDENYNTKIEEWANNNDINNIVHDGTFKRNRYHHGFIAQEVKTLCDNLGIDFGGYQDHLLDGGKDIKSIGYDEFIAPMIKTMQVILNTIDELTNKNVNLQNKLNIIKNKIQMKKAK
jgi:hypothetical protein